MRKILTRLLVETTEISTVTRQKARIRAFCKDCGRRTTMLRPVDAADLLRERTSYIFFLINRGRVHYITDCSGNPLICLPSLSSL